MSSVKCFECGLVNFANETNCKRCGSPLKTSLPTGVVPQGIVLEDGYVLPPPPTMAGSGIWRDRSTVVVSKDAELPDRCFKCNAQAYGFRLKRKLSWHHPALYLIIFVALLIYLIVAMVVRKSAVVQIGLCEAHRAKRRRAIISTWTLVGAGIALVFLSAAVEDGTFALIGMLLLFAGIIYGTVAIRVVAASKIDDRFAWLKGAGNDYLNQLPQWPGIS